MDISGKKALVFGGTSGIGLAAAKQLVDLGAEVIVASRQPDKAGELPAGITARQCDALDVDSVQALLNEVGTIDILVSSATGGSRAIGRFDEMDMAGYRSSFDKLWGYANVVRYGISHLSERGAIVLVSGTPARNGRAGQVALSSVGGAVESLVRHVAKEIAPKRINVMSPGLIDTPMVALTGDERKAHYEKVTETFLLKRVGTADEAAQGIIFLIQNEYATGTTVDVDGGWLLS